VDRVRDLDPTRKRYRIIRALINQQITDVVQTTHANLERHGVKSPDEVRRLDFPVVDYSAEMAEKNDQLRAFLMDNFYRHYRLIRMSRKATRIIESLFNEYLADPRQLPPTDLRQDEDAPLERIVCDYIAGMTDRYALKEYERLFDPYERV
jgi:dGTPase